ncbi:DMT family transporter [Solirhodobacter olei]|uniref:DMT family transporter n=1 Tax=Solirhodobacter olei TaxID=2493082 RepID=UPI000FD6F2DB|nr:DMT family transporter [Solirhodobacter olei]
MRVVLLVALTMVAFAANSVLNRMAMVGGGIGPSAFAAIRLLSGALALAAMVRVRGAPLPLTTRARRLGVPSLAVYMLGFSFAYLSLDAGIGALILFGAVQITMFAGAVLAGEPVPGRRWIGAAVAFAGLAWLLWPEGASAPPPVGAVLMAAAGIGWGLYSLNGRGAADPQAETAANFLLAAPVALILWALVPGTVALAPRGVGLAVLSGVVTSGLGYALWYAVLPRIAASAAAVAQLTVPLIAMAGGMVFLAEAPSLRFIGAAVLVLGGVGLSLVRRRRAS